MERLRAHDGTVLAYRVVGDGPPLVCLPGGPGQGAAYLGDLGGLSAHRTLILLDNRGTGASAVPADPATYRVDRLADDVEALRRHLDLPRMDLLGHSAAGGLALLHAAAHPDGLRRLVLVTPSPRVLGLPGDLDQDAVLARRAAEPWFAEADAARIAWLQATSAEETQRWWLASAPLAYGRWDAAARAHAAASADHARPARDGFYAGFAPDPSLPPVTAPTLVLAGEHDLWPTPASARAIAARLPHGELTIQQGAGHFPWIDDPAAFTTAIERFLR